MEPLEINNADGRHPAAEQIQIIDNPQRVPPESIKFINTYWQFKKVDTRHIGVFQVEREDANGEDTA